MHVLICEGIDDFDNADFQVYPVPFSDFLNVSLPTGISKYIIQLYDSNGKLLLESADENHFQKFSAKDLPDGICLIRLSTPSASISRRILHMK